MRTPMIYDLIVQSEDKNRTVFETLIYAVLTLSAVVSIFYAAVQPVIMPGRIVAKQAEYRV